jgi:hypothetical protein
MDRTHRGSADRSGMPHTCPAAEAYLLPAGAAVDVFGLRSNEIPDAVRQSVIHEYPRLGFKREFAGLLQAEAKQVPRGRAWYLHRFAMSDLSMRLAPFRG